MRTKNGKKIWFLQALRGVCVCLVVFSHLCVVFWQNNDYAAQIANVYPLGVHFELITISINDFMLKYNLSLSQIGVSIFFLISGFVIPISLERLKVKRFLIARVFRIYPIVIASISITCICICIYSQKFGLNFPYSLSYWLINVSLQREWFWILPIEYSIWTLEVEFKFYLICALIYHLGKMNSSKIYIIVSSIFAVFNIVTVKNLSILLDGHHDILYRIFYVICSNDSYIIIMFIGICFYNYSIQKWSRKEFFTNIVMLYSYFFVSCEYNINPSIVQREIRVTHLVAICIFAFLYYIREKVPYSKILDFIANISFPLYISHGTIGYIIETLLYEYIISNPYLTMSITVIIDFFLAYVLHVLVEIPSDKIGKKISSYKHKIL